MPPHPLDLSTNATLPNRLSPTVSSQTSLSHLNSPPAKPLLSSPAGPNRQRNPRKTRPSPYTSPLPATNHVPLHTAAEPHPIPPPPPLGATHTQSITHAPIRRCVGQTVRWPPRHSALRPNPRLGPVVRCSVQPTGTGPGFFGLPTASGIGGGGGTCRADGLFGGIEICYGGDARR